MRKQTGFTLVELMVVILIIGILVAIAVPVFFNTEKDARAAACRDNLRMVDAAIMQYGASSEGNFSINTEDYAPAFMKTWPDCPAADLPLELDSATIPPSAICPYSTPHTY